MKRFVYRLRRYIRISNALSLALMMLLITNIAIVLFAIRIYRDYDLIINYYLLYSFVLTSISIVIVLYKQYLSQVMEILVEELNDISIRETHEAVDATELKIIYREFGHARNYIILPRYAGAVFYAGMNVMAMLLLVVYTR